MKTVQEIFNIALENHYGKSIDLEDMFMCHVLLKLVDEGLITQEEADSADEEIHNLLTPEFSTLVNFVVDRVNGMFASEFIRYGKRIYSDWDNKEATIQAIREELETKTPSLTSSRQLNHLETLKNDYR